jgi:hypothetical protein
MAGGHGGLTFLGEVMLKPTNAREEQFYAAMVAQLPQLPPHLGDDRAAGETLRRRLRKPLIARCVNAAVALTPHVPRYYGGYTENGGTYIALENLAYGLAHPAILDVKIGAITCSLPEMIGSERGAASAWLKKQKMNISDALTLSSTRGFRVVSATGFDHYGRMQLARVDPEVVLGRFFTSAATRKAAAERVAAFIDAVDWSQYAMIAASVLIVVGSGGEVRVKVIDFAHSYAMGGPNNFGTDVKFDKYSVNFSHGLRSFAQALRGVGRS